MTFYIIAKELTPEEYDVLLQASQGSGDQEFNEKRARMLLGEEVVAWIDDPEAPKTECERRLAAIPREERSTLGSFTLRFEYQYARSQENIPFFKGPYQFVFAWTRND